MLDNRRAAKTPFAIPVQEIWIKIRSGMGDIYASSLVGIKYREPNGLEVCEMYAEPTEGTEVFYREIHQA